MAKLNWSCTSCGMSSPRRSSVQRHIDNYNIHNGLGQVVPFVEYTVGRREGKYFPQKVPQFTRSKSPFLEKAIDKIEAELENRIVKEIADRIYPTLFTDQNKIELNKLQALAVAKIFWNNRFRSFSTT